MEKDFLYKEIIKLKDEKNAVILAHNYQVPEVQDIADFLGDSLGLSIEAGKTSADVIVFCGVHFMAETASIISPKKKVLIPDLEAGCSLASSINIKQLKEWKVKHPGAIVVSYVNTTADVKAESDYCVTSSNAVKVVNSIPADKEILFLPDKYLGNYIEMVTGRKMIIWDGACHVHEKIGNVVFKDIQVKYPDAEFLIHPECGCSTSCLVRSQTEPHGDRMKIFSTEGMLRYAKSSESKSFVVATEIGILHRMKKIAPEKSFYPVSEKSVCEYMKTITLEKLYYSLLYDQFEVKVPEEIAIRASTPIQRMLEIV
ncbi:MAG: quinolinate synthase [Ignavibacteria bacterium RBG_16_34_14]|nr:MAG: quinolinate synthase [Ignavibacteria bacterium RBG_16_34_14]